jgi:EmrB/QacA subfamily drug resistance transporter
MAKRVRNGIPGLETALPHVVLSRRRRRVVTGGILLGMVLAALEATVVTTAMPTIIASLGGLERYSWVFSAYLLTSTVAVPAWGRLSDLYGRRPLYLTGVVLFLLGSALSGMSHSIDQLIVFRAVQGLGAGALVPLSLTINGDIYTLIERTRIQGLFSGLWGVASIVGPIVGAVVTERISWRWVFYLNIPFGLAAAVVVGVALVEPKRAEKPTIDYAGAAWLALCITLLLMALVATGNAGSEHWFRILAESAGALVFGILFLRTERRAKEPIIPLGLFRSRIIAVGCLTVFLVGTAFYGALSYIPLFVQGALGGTATQAGSELTPLLLGWVTMSVVGARLLLRIGYRPTVFLGLILLAAGFAMLSNLGPGARLPMMMADMALMGAGMGMVMIVLLIMMQDAVVRDQLGIVTSINLFCRSIGGALGVAVMGAVMTAELGRQVARVQSDSGLPATDVAPILHNLSALVEPGSRARLGPAVLAALETALATSLHYVFLIGAIFATLALISGFWLPRSLSKSARAGPADGGREETPSNHEDLPLADEPQSAREA